MSGRNVWSIALTVMALLLAAFQVQRSASGAGRYAAVQPTAEIVVSAAASLQEVLTAAATEFNTHTPGTTVRLNFGSSGALAQQIAAGAPVDLFVSAGQQPVDTLIKAGLLRPDSVRAVASNSVVLVAPQSATVSGWSELAESHVRHVAIGDPNHVPAGEYARQVLEHLGIWSEVQPKLVFAQDVRAVLQHVATGAVDAGIVYATDVAGASQVTTVAAAPPGSHRPAAYVLAVPGVVPGAAPQAAAAAEFAAFLASPAGQAIWQQAGFRPAR